MKFRSAGLVDKFPCLGMPVVLTTARGASHANALMQCPETGWSLGNFAVLRKSSLLKNQPTRKHFQIQMNY